MSERVLVIAAHADDEVLGCGATIAGWAARGDEIGVVVLTKPAEGDPAVSFRYTETAGDETWTGPSAESPVVRRRREAQMAGRVLGVTRMWFGEAIEVQTDVLPLPPVVADLRAVLEEWQPATVLTHHWADLNQDHRRACEATVIAVRRPGPVTRVWAYGVDPLAWPPRAPRPGGVWVDVQATLPVKLAALACYQSEQRPFPHKRSPEAVEAAARAAAVGMGLHAAEVFEVIWEVAR